MKKQFLYLVLTAALFAGCKKLEQVPQSTTSRSAVFGNEKGMELICQFFLCNPAISEQCSYCR
jgi:hypothetical protein